MKLNPYRIAALTIVVLGTALMMWMGKQHTLIVENTAHEIGGALLPPFEIVLLKISEKDELEIYEDESDYVEPVGPFYTLEVEIPDEDGGPSRFLKKKLYLGFRDRIVVNIPQLAREKQ